MREAVLVIAVRRAAGIRIWRLPVGARARWPWSCGLRQFPRE